MAARTQMAQKPIEMLNPFSQMQRALVNQVFNAWVWAHEYASAGKILTQAS
jgi:hypothetical protein